MSVKVLQMLSLRTWKDFLIRYFLKILRRKTIMSKNQNQLALVKKDTVDVVAERVRQFQERGEIHFPANYSPENAMKSAWLILQNTQDRNKKPALEVCTKDSIANSL